MGREKFTIGELTNKGVDNGTVIVQGRNTSGKITKCESTSLPTVASSGFAPNCKLVLTNAALGMSAEWRNIGSNTSSMFIPVTGPVNGYGFGIVGSYYSVGGDATENIRVPGAMVTSDLAFVQHGIIDDNDTIAEATIVEDGEITLVGSVDPTDGNKQYQYFCLRQRVPFQTHLIKLAGTRAAVTADDATIAITATGVLSTDYAFGQVVVTDDTDTISGLTTATGSIVIKASADPDTDDTHSWDYFCLSPYGLFQPTHYIAYAGAKTAVGGDQTEVITATGALATDKVLVLHATSDDTDTISKAVVTADTITLLVTVNPGTSHSYNYMLLRSY